MPSCVGRSELIAAVRACVAAGPCVVALHGEGGIGKSTVTTALVNELRHAERRVMAMDGAVIEPSEAAFMEWLATELDTPTSERLNPLQALEDEAVVIVIDSYERQQLLDAWLRQELAPRLGPGAALLLVGRQAPATAWALAAGVRFREIQVGPLDVSAQEELLAALGVVQERMESIIRLARGHPLALRLAASLQAGLPAEFDTVRVINALVRWHLSEIPNPQLRYALLRASVVRRVTIPVLRALMPNTDSHAVMQELAALPMAAWANDGIALHDAVREALASHFQAIDPNGHREARQAAWQILLHESRSAGHAELWRYTADMLYLVEAPAVRDAFFPTRSKVLAVEPARPLDRDSVLSMTHRQEGDAGRELIAQWWRLLPDAFRVTRGDSGEPTGYSCMIERAALPPPLAESDPIVRAWLDHLRVEPVDEGETVLFLRALSDGRPAQVSEVKAALMLDMKRSYLKWRPSLRRLYAHIRSPDDFNAFLRQSGFRRLPEHDLVEPHAPRCITLLDFGPLSVDGWLAQLAATTLQKPDEPAVRLDERARELQVDGQRVGLTPLEFELMGYLMARPSEAVKRGDLLDDIWGTKYEGGSNVIDVAIRGLRRKLGLRAACIETVPRFGYRFRAP